MYLRSHPFVYIQIQAMQCMTWSGFYTYVNYQKSILPTKYRVLSNCCKRLLPLDSIKRGIILYNCTYTYNSEMKHIVLISISYLSVNFMFMFDHLVVEYPTIPKNTSFTIFFFIFLLIVLLLEKLKSCKITKHEKYA